MSGHVQPQTEDRRQPSTLPRFCVGVYSTHDGRGTRTYVMGLARPKPIRLCNGCHAAVKGLVPLREDLRG